MVNNYKGLGYSTEMANVPSGSFISHHTHTLLTGLRAKYGEMLMGKCRRDAGWLRERIGVYINVS